MTKSDRTDLDRALQAERFLPIPSPARSADWVDPQAAHHCRVLLFELAQASDWGQARRQADAVKREADRVQRAVDKAARAQGVRNVVDDPH